MFEMTERSFAISNVSTDVSLTESFNPQLQAETASPPVLEGHEEAREAGVLGKLPTPQADTTIDRRPPAPLPRDRSQPISGYEAVVRTNAATASDYIYATTRDRTPASTHLTVAQRQQSQAAGETTPLVGPSPRQQQQRHQTPQQVTQLQEITAAFLAMLGIGRWYAGACVLILFLFYAGGTTLIVISTTNSSSTTRQVSNILCGTALILLSLLWPLAWTCNKFERNRRRNFGVLFFYGWLASLFYSGAVGALAVSVDYHCFFHCEEFDSKMSFWVLIGMLILPVALAAGILCTYAICRVAGRRGGSYLRIVV